MSLLPLQGAAEDVDAEAAGEVGVDAGVAHLLLRQLPRLLHAADAEQPRRHLLHGSRGAPAASSSTW